MAGPNETTTSASGSSQANGDSSSATSDPAVSSPQATPSAPSPSPISNQEALAGLVFTPAQVAFLLSGGFGSKGLASASTGQSSVPITSAAFPQFVPPANIPSPTGTSLIKLFPHIEASVLLEIARHEFKPSDLSKLDSKYRDRAARSVLEFDAIVGGFTIRDPSTKDYPSLHSIFAPLITYFQILTMFAASSGSTAAVGHVAVGSFAYLSQLEQFNEDYQWSAVLAYHMDFHYKRRSFMADGDYSGWDTIDAGLQAKHLIGKERLRIVAVRSKNPSGSAASATLEVCRLFNRGACESPCRHKRIHKCSGCGSTEHGRAACPTAKPLAA